MCPPGESLRGSYFRKLNDSLSEGGRLPSRWTPPVTPPPRLADAVQKAVDEYERVWGVKPDIAEVGPDFVPPRVQLYNDDGYHPASDYRPGDVIEEQITDKPGWRVGIPKLGVFATGYSRREAYDYLGSVLLNEGIRRQPCEMFEGYVGSTHCHVCGWPVSEHAS